MLVEHIVEHRFPGILPSTSHQNVSTVSAQAVRTMDRAAQSVVRYHAGWCVVAVRRDLMKSAADSSKYLELIDKFGCDVLSSSNVCTETSSSSSSDDDPDRAREPVEGESVVKSRAFRQKHVFELATSALSLFSRMHTVCEEHLSTLLHSDHHSALAKLKELLERDDVIIANYRSVVDESDKENVLLRMLIKMFVKSKQKAIVREHQLAPATSSIALRAGLQQQERRRQSHAAGQGDSTHGLRTLRSAIESGSIESIRTAINDLAASKESIMAKLTVMELKQLLKTTGASVTGTKPALLERAKKVFQPESSIEGKKLLKHCLI